MSGQNMLHIELIGDDVTLQDMYQEQYETSKQKVPYMDSGFDLFFPNEVVCLSGKSTKIKLGVKIAMFRNCDDSKPSVGYYIYPRSSISKTPLRLANSVGIIDSGYRGELMVVVDNQSVKDYVVKRGQRLFQVCAGDLTPICKIKFCELNSTERGSGGFGSTGL
jgi:dUTP pyrophosphatase